MENVLELTEQTFDEEIAKTSGVCVLDFWAEWCAPCKALAPVLKQVADEFFGKVKVLKVNIDEAPAIATQFDVMSIPTLVFFKDGEIVKKTTGVAGKETIQNILNELL